MDAVIRRPTAAAHNDDPAGRRHAGSTWTWLAIIIAAAAVLRTINLNSGLWQDEIAATMDTIRSPVLRILTSYPADSHHPLFSLLAHMSAATFGEAPWSLRLPAVLFGVATIPALYLLGRHVATRTEALLACAVLAVSYHHVWFSQNARGYTALALFTVLAIYVLLRAIETNAWRWFGLYALLGGLAAYTHLTMVFLVAAHALPCAWLTFGPRSARRIHDWRLTVLAFGGAALLTVTLYLPMLDEVLWWFLHRPSKLLGASTPSWALLEGIRVLALGLGVHPAVLAGGALVFGAGVTGFWRRDPLIVWLFLLPAAATIAGALLTRGTMYPRFFFYLAGVLLLIVVHGAFVVGRIAGRLLPAAVPQRDRALGWLLVLLMIVASIRSLGYNYAFPKQDFERAIAYVEDTRHTGDTVVVAGPTYPYAFYGKDWSAVADVAQLRTLREQRPSVWVLYVQPRYIELDAPGLVAAIEADCTERGQFDGTVGGGDVIVCRLPPL